MIAKNEGFSPIIYTIENSWLEKKAYENKIETIIHSGRVKATLLRWHRLRHIPKILSSYNVEIVHCYELNFMWPLSFYMRRFRHIPLFLTQAKEIKKDYSSVLFKPLSSRVDQVFIPFSGLEKNVMHRLGLAARKLASIGLGVDPQYDQSFDREIFSRRWRGDDDKTFLVGTNIALGLKDISQLETLLYAMLSVQSGEKDFSVRMVLYSEHKWTERTIYPSLVRAIKDLGIEESVIFYSDSTIDLFQQHLHIWLGDLLENELDDYSVLAMIHGLPVVMPRSLSSMEVLRLFGPIGETFKRGDSRAIRTQVLKVISERKHYTRQLKSMTSTLVNSFGVGNYEQTLAQCYLKSYQIRHRYWRLHNR